MVIIAYVLAGVGAISLFLGVAAICACILAGRIEKREGLK